MWHNLLFSSVVGGDIGGRGSARLQVFYEKDTQGKNIFKPNQKLYKTDWTEFSFAEKSLNEALTLWSEEILKLVQSRQAHFKKDPIRAIGLAFPGTIKNNTTVVLADNLTKNTQAQWKNVNFQKCLPVALKSVFKQAGLSSLLAEDIKVTLANDLVVGSLGERVYGSGKTFNPKTQGVINLIQVGTGYGGATMIVTSDMDILLGGEPGQVIVDTDTKNSVEDFVGHHSLQEYAKKLGLGEDVKPKTVFSQAFNQSLPADVREKAQLVVTQVVEKLAQAVAFDVQRYNLPKRIIIGGGIPRGIDKASGKNGFLTPFITTLKNHTRTDEFVQTEFKMATFENNLVGAAILSDTDRYSEISPKKRSLVF